MLTSIIEKRSFSGRYNGQVNCRWCSRARFQQSCPCRSCAALARLRRATATGLFAQQTPQAEAEDGETKTNRRKAVEIRTYFRRRKNSAQGQERHETESEPPPDEPDEPIPSQLQKISRGPGMPRQRPTRICDAREEARKAFEGHWLRSTEKELQDGV